MWPGPMIRPSRRVIEPMAQNPRQSSRRLWLSVHRWLGLAVGLVLALIGLSGSILAMKGPILRWELGAAAYEVASQSGPMLSEAEWKVAASRAYPQFQRVMGDAPPHGGFFDNPNATVFGQVEGRPRAMGVALVDPWTGAPRRFFVYDDLAIAKVVAFHRSLFLPPTIGGPLLALTGLILLFSTTTGLWLWWPFGGQWRQRLFPSFRRIARLRLIEWHRLAGAWVALPMLLLAGTGVWLAAPGLWASLFGEVRRGAAGARGPSVVANLHANLLLGPVGQVLVGLSGVVLTLLVVTGLWQWWARSRRRS